MIQAMLYIALVYIPTIYISESYDYDKTVIWLASVNSSTDC